MKIYLISQAQNSGYDTYDSAVVVAPDEETARRMNPDSGESFTDEEWEKHWNAWCSGPEQVEVHLIGMAAIGIEQGVICSSFNAG